MKRSTFIEAIAIFFMILFLYTGISKLLDYDVAVEQVTLSPLLAPVAGLLMLILPIMEILTAIALFLPKTRIYGLFSSLMLMTLFTGYVAYILNYNDEIPCTCGGILKQMSWPQHLVFNITSALLALAAVIMSLRYRFPTQHVGNSQLH